MNTTTVHTRKPDFTLAGRPTRILLLAAAAAAVFFIAKFALRYFALNEAALGGYWPYRGWLLLHIASGVIALLIGPGQLWLGLNRKSLHVHRRLGTVYLTNVGLGSIAAFYLVAHTTLGWVFGAGITGLAIAWMVTTGLAFVAVRRGLIEQHKEWMVRSYVVTFAFVSFRMLFKILQIAEVGTPQERLGVASWFCWAFPLLVTESVLQGKKVLSRLPSQGGSGNQRVENCSIDITSRQLEETIR